MANTGKGAAYLQLRPLQNTAGQDARYWADEAFRRRQEERISENQRLNRQAEAEKERNARRDKYMKFAQPYDTKSQSMNEVVGRVIKEGNEEIGRIANKLISGDFKDAEEETRLRVKLNNLQNLPEKMKMVTDGLSTRHDEVMKLKEAGAIKDNENFRNYEKVFQMGAEGFQGLIDANGNPAIAYRDLDGDGILDIEGFDEISQGLSAFKFDKNIDVDKLATNLVSGLGTNKTVTDTNYLKTTTQGPDPKALEYATYAAMINRDGDLTDAGKSFMEDLGLKDTLENRDKMMEEWKKIVGSKIDYTNEEDFDYGARTSASREARLRDKENNTNQGPIESIPITKDVWGGAYFGNIQSDKVNSVGGGGIVLEAPKDYQGKTYDNAKVLNYTFDKFGSLLLDVEYIDNAKEVNKASSGRSGDDTTTTTREDVVKRKVIQVAPEDAREFASKKGMTIDELKKSAQKDPTAKRGYRGLDEDGNPIFD